MRSERTCGLYLIPLACAPHIPTKLPVRACAKWSSAEAASRGAQAGDWPAAQRLLGALAAAGMEAAAAPEVARALCAAVSQRLAPRRAALYPDGPRGRCLLDKRARGPGLARRPLSRVRLPWSEGSAPERWRLPGQAPERWRLPGPPDDACS